MWCVCVCVVCVCVLFVYVCVVDTCLNPGVPRGKALIEIIACKRNVSPELRTPQGHLFGERGPQHGVDRAVAHLQTKRNTSV